MSRKAVLFIAALAWCAHFGGSVGHAAQEDEPAWKEIVLSPSSEKLFESMGLSHPDIMRKVRILLQPADKTSRDEMIQLTCELGRDDRPEARRALRSATSEQV